jgi:hypothetical protein
MLFKVAPASTTAYLLTVGALCDLTAALLVTTMTELHSAPPTPWVIPLLPEDSIAAPAAHPQPPRAVAHRQLADEAHAARHDVRMVGCRLITILLAGD